MRLDGSIQMDAPVMVDSNFGSVINIEFVKNPVPVAVSIPSSFFRSADTGGLPTET